MLSVCFGRVGLPVCHCEMFSRYGHHALTGDNLLDIFNRPEAISEYDPFGQCDNQEEDDADDGTH